MDFHRVSDALEEAVAQGVFPGAVLLVGKENEIVYEQAFGWRSLVPAKNVMQTSTIFDLASLTKPLATTVAIMLLVCEDKLRLDDRVTQFCPTFGCFGKDGVTVRHLLSHCSGLAAWKPYYEEITRAEKEGKINFVGSQAAKHYVYEQIHRERPLTPPGAQSLYSDLGFILLGEIVETISGEPLDRFCQENIFKPLGLSSTSFMDLTQYNSRRTRSVHQTIAATENCPWRKKVLCGEVHDDNAYAIGGVAGHAGLFSSARDIHEVAERLSRCLRGEDSFLPQALVQQFLTRDRTVRDSTFALGWDTPSGSQSTSGKYFSARSVGHLGFTGTSIWWDLEKHCHIVLLSNRVHPARTNEKIREFRPQLHDLIMKSLHP